MNGNAAKTFKSATEELFVIIARHD